MVESSTHIEVGLANPSIDLRPSANGYTLTATQNTSLIGQIGTAVLLLLCLTFLAAGIAIWFAPDTVFDGDPMTLKLIVTGATWLVFGPILYFSFFNRTTQVAEVDLKNRHVHQVFFNKHGRETKRRSFAFADISDLVLVSNTSNTTDDPRDMISHYGHIRLRLNARKGVSLIWGAEDDLQPVLARLRADVLGAR